VGPPSAVPGDPDGVVITDSGPGVPAVPPMRPAAWSGWPADWNTPNWSGQVTALADTAWMCLDLNASIIATMPPYLVGAADSTPTEWMTNPDPDRYSSWEDFAKDCWWNYQLGEVFILATAYYATGYPARFHVVEPWLVDVDFDGAQRRRYTIGGQDVTADICHVRYRTRTTNARGEGPLDAGAARLVAAEVLNRYATNLAASGGTPPSILTHPDTLDAKQSSDLQTQWVTARMAGVGLPAVLSGGVKWEAVAISPADMALLDLAQFNESRIANLLGVPPFLVGLPSGGDSMTYSNVSSIFDFHWRAGLRPKASAVCAALSGWLVPRGTTLELNRDEYVRSDPKTRAETWQILISIGVLSIEEVRTFERFGVGAEIGVVP
jgi:HK97 family phage portal protein